MNSMNFRKPRDSGLVKRIVRFQMVNHNPHLTAAEKYHVVKNRYVSLKAYEEMEKRARRFRFY